MDGERKAPEAEWLALGNPHEILRQLPADQVTYRKRRLFVCACLRHMQALLPALPFASVLDMAERVADGLERHDQLQKCRANARALPPGIAAAWAFEAVQAMQLTNLPQVAIENAARAVRDQARGRDWSAALKQQTTILCDILGHLLHTTTIFDPVWLQWNDGTVRKMACTIYEENTFTDVPILADALEEAGCENPAILHHCRAKMRHYRGCWVVDALLSKN